MVEGEEMWRRLEIKNGQGSSCAELEYFFFSSRRRHTRYWRDWSSDVCSSDLERSMCNELLHSRGVLISVFINGILTCPNLKLNSLRMEILAMQSNSLKQYESIRKKSNNYVLTQRGTMWENERPGLVHRVLIYA